MSEEATLTITLTHEEWGEVIAAVNSKSCLVKKGYYGPEDKPGADVAWCATLGSAYAKLAAVLKTAGVTY